MIKESNLNKNMPTREYLEGMLFEPGLAPAPSTGVERALAVS